MKADVLIANGQSDAAMTIIQSAREKSLQAGNDKVAASMTLWLTERYIDLGQFFMARKYIEEALKTLKNSQHKYQLARAYNLHGSLLVHLGQFAEGQKQLIQASKLFEQLNKKRAVGAVYINMGNNYLEMKEIRKARECYSKACEIAFSLRDTANYISAMNGMSQLFTTTNPDSSWFYLKKILEFYPERAWSVELLPIRFQMANIHCEKKEYGKALALYNQILDTCLKKSINIGVYRAYSGLGNLYEAIQQDRKALEMYVKAYDLAVAAGETPTALNLQEAILYMYKKAGDYTHAFLVLEQMRRTNDSLLSLEKQLTVHDLEMMYNKEKADRNSDAMKADMESMKRQIRFNQTILGVTLIFLATLSLLLLSIYRLYRQRDLAYQTLIEKYREDVQLMEHPVLIPSIQASITRVPDAPPTALEDEYYEQILSYFSESKPYLNPQLKIEDIARALHIPRKILSTVITTKSGVHFTTFVNNYRVQEALRLFASPEYRNIKIEHIAHEAGFGSKVSFYTAFTQVTGFKPGNYRDKADI